MKVCNIACPLITALTIVNSMRSVIECSLREAFVAAYNFIVPKHGMVGLEYRN